MTQLMLPYYKKGTVEYKRLRDRTWIFKKKYGFKIIRPTRFDNLVKNGQKYCGTCFKFKNFSEYYFRPTEKRFESNCLSCRTEYRKKRSIRERTQVLKKIQDKIECVRCGCNIIEFLEINHKNGGGWKELKDSPFYTITQSIEYGRNVDDLEILCRPCNSIHFLEMKISKKYGYTVNEVPLKVVFDKSFIVKGSAMMEVVGII